jgi:hypothetical protein
VLFFGRLRRLSFLQLRKLATAAAMNVTSVEVVDVMSVLSPVCSAGPVRWDREANENGTAAALPDNARDALFGCVTATGCSGFVTL